MILLLQSLAYIVSSAKYISTSDELNVSSTNGGLSRLVDITVPANQIVEYPIGPNGIYFMPATLNANRY
ncbi:MAG: hypothetical protein IPN87_20195 [Saprospiraceae bacterium]|nr:hypothetical protein [Candidatus Brachybacter algidus]